MSEWKEIEFSKMLVDETLSYGVVQPGSHTEVDSVPIIRGNNIRKGKVEVDDIMKVSKRIEEKHKRTRLTGGELLITVVGSVGECAIAPREISGWNVARAVSVAKMKEEYDARFIKYAFSTTDIVNQIYGNTNDTVQPTLNLTELKRLTIRTPELVEQQSIAEVLSSLDDKIDLLHQQNKTLEALAETLFRQWFVEENRDTTGLAHYISIQNGYAFRSDDFTDTGNFGIIKITNISFDFIDTTTCDYVSDIVGESVHKRFEVKSGSFLIAMTGAEIGKIGIVGETNKKLLLNQRVGMVCDKIKGSSLLGYFFLKSIEGQDHIVNTATGSAQPNISAEGILNMPVPYKTEEEQKRLIEIIEPFITKKCKNLAQIHQLETLRNNLLPKLMSGAVTVSNP